MSQPDPAQGQDLPPPPLTLHGLAVLRAIYVLAGGRVGVSVTRAAIQALINRERLFDKTAAELDAWFIEARRPFQN